jgi:phage tail tube protein FII
MANLVVTSTTNSIKVDFGVLGVIPNPKKGTWKKDKVENIKLEISDTYVRVTTIGEPEWQLSWNGTNVLQVDSIDGVAPISNSDLYDKLIALIA